MRVATTLILPAVSLFSVVAAKSGWGEACDQTNTHLDPDTWALVTDCDATTYCNANGTCAYKGCRRDVYPYGYNGVSFDQLPPLCPNGQACPDEGDACIDQVAVDGKCQKDRDDECQPPSNWHDLNGYLNTNGSICLNYTCYWSNVTIGQTCFFDNTAYTAFTDDGTEYAFIVSRDNCANGLYCDGTSKLCMKDKRFGETCAGNKECLSYNCMSDGKCGRAADEPIHPGAYVYALVAIGLVALIVGVMTALWFTHRRSRKENQVRLEQYYNEQIAYRQSIMSMSHAKNSLLSIPPDSNAAAPRQSTLVADDSFGYSSSLSPTSAEHPQLRDPSLPPNMRRDSSAGWSEAGDSEGLLMHNGAPSAQTGRRYRG